MAEFAALHLSPDIADAVTRLGWAADDPVMRDAAPTAARGHNLVALLPPVPAAAGAVIQAHDQTISILSRFHRIEDHLRPVARDQ